MTVSTMERCSLHNWPGCTTCQHVASVATLSAPRHAAAGQPSPVTTIAAPRHAAAGQSVHAADQMTDEERKQYIRVLGQQFMTMLDNMTVRVDAEQDSINEGRARLDSDRKHLDSIRARTVGPGWGPLAGTMLLATVPLLYLNLAASAILAVLTFCLHYAFEDRRRRDVLPTAVLLAQPSWLLQARSVNFFFGGAAAGLLVSGQTWKVLVGFLALGFAVAAENIGRGDSYHGMIEERADLDRRDAALASRQRKVEFERKKISGLDFDNYLAVHGITKDVPVTATDPSIVDAFDIED